MTKSGKRREYRTNMKFDYDHRHRVVEGKELSPGDRVWIPDLKVDGTVIKQHESPRSIVIQTPNGPVTRNQRMTRRVLEGSPPVHENHEPVVTSVMVPDLPSAPGASQEERGHLPVQEDQIVVNEPSQQETCPNRLDLEEPLEGLKDTLGTLSRDDDDINENGT